MNTLISPYSLRHDSRCPSCRAGITTKARSLLQLATVSAILAAFPTLASAAALNDTAVGTGTVLGNALNPGPERAQPQDPNWPTAKHTPSGQMFTLPFAVPDIRR